MVFDRLSTIAAAIAFTVTPASVQAQDRYVLVDGLPHERLESQGVGGAIVGAVLGASIGLFGGALIGIAVECGNDCSGEWDGFAGAILGGLAGETLLLPIGAHMGNGFRGNLGAGLGVSAAAAASTVLLAAASDSPEVLLLGAMGQLVATIVTEITTGERRQRRFRTTIGASPHGGVMVGARVAL